MAKSFAEQAREAGFGELRLGGKPLIEEPLDERDWQEVHNAYLAFTEHMRLIAARARDRALRRQIKERLYEYDDDKGHTVLVELVGRHRLPVKQPADPQDAGYRQGYFEGQHDAQVIAGPIGNIDHGDEHTSEFYTRARQRYEDAINPFLKHSQRELGYAEGFDAAASARAND